MRGRMVKAWMDTRLHQSGKDRKASATRIRKELGKHGLERARIDKGKVR